MNKRVIKVHINVIKEYLGINAEIFLDNGLKYTGYIHSTIGTTIIFLDKFDQKIPFEAKAVISINPLPKNSRGYF